MGFTRRFKIGNRGIGEGEATFIIAEAGVNHNGSIDLAKDLVREAKNVGADCVKFQTFRARDLVTAAAPKAGYQLDRTDPAESQLAMLEKLELSKDDHEELMALCKVVGIIFLSTPYNMADVELLDSLGAPAYKLASMHLTELPMIEYTARKGKPVILSTGMGTLAEVRLAATEFEKTGNESLSLLQCTTDYPAKLEEANLRTMRLIADATGAVVGYSDNSDDVDLPIFAVAAGAKIIEKHFTLDKKMPGPDHAASANPAEFQRIVERIRSVERALGSQEKIVSERESKNKTAMRRSLVAVVDIRKDDTIATDMLTFKRPASGLSPNRLHDVIGKKAACNIPADTILTEEMIVW